MGGNGTDRPAWRVVAAIFLAAWALRAVAAIFLPNMHHPDEIFQTLEQGHRFAFGYGIIPWEFEHGLRSWLLPGLIGLVMRASTLAGEGPDVYLAAVALVLGAIGAAPVACAYLWARRLFDETGARLAALVPLVAPDTLYFGAKALTEAVAGHVLVVGLYLALPGRPATSSGRMALAGALLALAVAIRLQMAPAAALAGLAVVLLALPLAGPRIRHLAGAPAGEAAPLRPLPAVAFALGGLAMVAFAGAFDWATWGSPFLSYRHNFLYNITYGVSDHFGTDPAAFYAVRMLIAWGASMAAVVLLACLGAPLKPILALMAVAVALPHHLIAHKEVRFLYPAVVMVLILAGFGLARIAAHPVARGLLLGPDGAVAPRRRLAAVGLGTLCLLGWTIAYVPTPAAGIAWAERRDEIRASRAVSRLAGVCGIGLYGIRWVFTGGYTHFHQRAPLYRAETPGDYAAQAPAFNVVVYPAALSGHTGVAEVACFDRMCVGQRTGACEARPVQPLDTPPPAEAVTPVRRLWPPDPSMWRAP